MPATGPPLPMLLNTVNAGVAPSTRLGTARIISPFALTQRLPSPPVVMVSVPLAEPIPAIGNWLTTPAAVMRPIALVDSSVNQSAPSGPPVMSNGTTPAVGMGNSVITPAVVERATALLFSSVNQRLLSGPLTM